MRKCRLFLLVICLMLSAPAYSQDDSKGNLFFSTGFYNGFFADRSLPLLPNIFIDRLTLLKIGGYWETSLGETPLGRGIAGFGLETGYSSGTNFGGRGDMDFFPIILSASYSFRPVDAFSFGPSLKLGAFAVNGPGWLRMIPLIGGRLEAEFRYPPFPVSLYATGGVDMFPMAEEFSTLPMVEVGLRFRRPIPRQSASSSSGRSQTTGAALTQGNTTDSQGTTGQSARGTTQTSSNTEIVSRVYFEPDTAVPIGNYRLALEEARRRLSADPSLRVVLQAYTAPFGTPEGRRMVSEIRANFCKDFLIQYGIAPGRITSVFNGSDRSPEQVTEDWASYRCVELVLVRQ